MFHRVGCVAQATCTSMFPSVKGAGVSRRADTNPGRQAKLASARVLGFWELIPLTGYSARTMENPPKGGQERIPASFRRRKQCAALCFCQAFGNCQKR